jgi:predicted Na+-dependent transporter
MLAALLATQLLPLLLGLMMRHRRPQLADRLLTPLELVSKVLNLSVAGLILGTQFRMLADIPMAGFAGMLILLVASLVIGWLAGGPGRDDRRTMALTTSLRNVGLGLVIVTGNFSDTPAVSAAFAYGIVEVLGSLVVALWWAGTSEEVCDARNQEAATCTARQTFSIALPSVADDARAGVALQASGELPIEPACERPAVGRNTPIVSLRRSQP